MRAVIVGSIINIWTVRDYTEMEYEHATSAHTLISLSLSLIYAYVLFSFHLPPLSSLSLSLLLPITYSLSISLSLSHKTHAHTYTHIINLLSLILFQTHSHSFFIPALFFSLTQSDSFPLSLDLALSLSRFSLFSLRYLLFPSLTQFPFSH